MQEEYVVSQKEVVAWIKKHAIALCDPQQESVYNSDYTDVRPLQKMVGAARIVTLGESTYGTHTVFLLKQRLLMFLVEEMGFTLLALPAPWSGTCALNDYIYSGLGDPEEMMVNMGDWHWMTGEMLDLIYWLRNYNERCRPEQKVSFCGLDCLPYIQAAIDNVLLYASDIDTQWSEQLSACYQQFGAYDADLTGYSQLSLQEHARCRQQLQQVYDDFVRQRTRLIAASTRDLYLEALQNVRVLIQAEEIAVSQDFARREYFIAENASWLLEHYRPKAKMVIWSHNASIALQAPSPRPASRQPEYLTFTSASDGVSSKGNSASGDLSYWSQEVTAGSYLLERYPNDLLTIGCSFYQGSFLALDEQQPDRLNHYNADNVPDDSFEAVFGMTEMASVLLDLRGPDAHEEAAHWFTEPHLSRCVRKSYHEELYWQPQYLLRCFDLYVFAHTSTEAELLPDVTQWVVQLPEQPYNLDFAHELDDWHIKGTLKHQVTFEPVSRKRSYTRLHVQSEESDIERYFRLAQEIQASEYRGQRIRLSAYIEVQDISEEVSLWLCIRKSDNKQLLGNSYCIDTQPRAQYSVVMDVPPESISIDLSIALCGTGQLWLDNLRLEIVGSDVPLTPLLT